MLIRDAGERLAGMLSAGGLTPGAATEADPRALVEVYQRFAAIPADDAAPAGQDGDGIRVLRMPPAEPVAPARRPRPLCVAVAVR